MIISEISSGRRAPAKCWTTSCCIEIVVQPRAAHAARPLVLNGAQRARARILLPHRSSLAHGTVTVLFVCSIRTHQVGRLELTTMPLRQRHWKLLGNMGSNACPRSKSATGARPLSRSVVGVATFLTHTSTSSIWCRARWSLSAQMFSPPSRHRCKSPRSSQGLWYSGEGAVVSRLPFGIVAGSMALVKGATRGQVKKKKSHVGSTPLAWVCRPVLLAYSSCGVLGP